MELCELIKHACEKNLHSATDTISCSTWFFLLQSSRNPECEYGVHTEITICEAQTWCDFGEKQSDIFSYTPSHNSS